ncbi:MAG: hypothetical protein JW808_03035, partial [Victivallales bacterium]|nr:hypothetical protein [Victivallales bacterium]
SANRTIFVRRGPAIDKLSSKEIMFDGTLINDVYALDGSGELAPTRGFTRPYMTYTPEDGYVLLCCVCPDYLPGRTYLLPALVVSKTGKPGTWSYLGMLKGEPETEAARIQQETKRQPRSDGGVIVKLTDGSWRIYLNWSGITLTALEAQSLQGPWRFLRDQNGAIVELLPEFPGNGIFPFVTHAGSDRWHARISDDWPPQSIWHYVSRDGVKWSPFGRQPEITRDAVGGRCIKCLRAYVDPQTRELVGLMSVWERQNNGKCGWRNYVSRMSFPTNLNSITPGENDELD